jgi:hypothetical protein
LQIVFGLNDVWILLWLSKKTVLPLLSRDQAIAYIEWFLTSSLQPQNPQARESEIQGRHEVSRDLLHMEDTNTQFADQLQSLTGVADEADIQEMEIRHLLYLLDAVPSQPSGGANVRDFPP